MVPNCVFRGGVCPEPKPCGMYNVKRYDPVEILRRLTSKEAYVEIPQAEHDNLLEQEQWVCALEDAGVDNWDGISEAYKTMEELNNE